MRCDAIPLPAVPPPSSISPPRCDPTHLESSIHDTTNAETRLDHAREELALVNGDRFLADRDHLRGDLKGAAVEALHRADRGLALGLELGADSESRSRVLPPELLEVLLELGLVLLERLAHQARVLVLDLADVDLFGDWGERARSGQVERGRERKERKLQHTNKDQPLSLYDARRLRLEAFSCTVRS